MGNTIINKAPEVIRVLNYVIAIMVTILTFLIGRQSYRILSERITFRTFGKEEDIEKINPINQARKKIAGWMEHSPIKVIQYDTIYSYLKKNGQIIPGVRNATPEMYLISKILILLSLALVSVVLKMSPVLTVIIILVGVFLQDIAIFFENKEDNKKMVSDIQRIYARMTMQINSNVYVANTFKDSYFYSKSARLKRAFLELDTQVKMTHDLIGALDEFESKFNNATISLLVRNIKHSAEAGQLSRALEDMKRESVELQKQQNTVYKENQERKFALVTLLIFGFMAGIIVYLLFGSFLNDISNLFSS